MRITETLLVQMLPRCHKVAALFVDPLNLTLARYRIDSPARIAAFIAQVGHESASLTRLVENLNYSPSGLANTWPGRFAIASAARPLLPNELAYSLAHKPERIANCVYANRLGNGPESSGDGWRYRGRGLMQITGRDNYRRVGQALRLPLEDQPELLEVPEPATLAAGQFWYSRGLNELADAGKFREITSRINPGLIGLPERIALRQIALDALAKA